MDRQAEKVYDWEDSFTLWAGAGLSQNQAKKIVRAVCEHYKIKPPSVGFFRSNKGASYYDPNKHQIKLRPRHLNPAIVIHEASHAIVYKILGSEVEAHGPEFVGIYMVLLTDCGISPRAALHCSAKAAGVEFRERSVVGPKNIRKRNARRYREARKRR